ncbi:hypothetical protein JW978_03295 [Candidatus Dojkabacteria bacterium]|nr:hypothetical protein [Candidatus Dojkabacteria bacterium]
MAMSEWSIDVVEQTGQCPEEEHIVSPLEPKQDLSENAKSKRPWKEIVGLGVTGITLITCFRLATEKDCRDETFRQGETFLNRSGAAVVFEDAGWYTSLEDQIDSIEEVYEINGIYIDNDGDGTLEITEANLAGIKLILNSISNIPGFSPEILAELGLDEIIIGDSARQTGLIILEDRKVLVVAAFPGSNWDITNEEAELLSRTQYLSGAQGLLQAKLEESGAMQKYREVWNVNLGHEINDENMDRQMAEEFAAYVIDPRGYLKETQQDVEGSIKLEILKQMWREIFPYMDQEFWMQLYNGETPEILKPAEDIR